MDLTDDTAAEDGVGNVGELRAIVDELERMVVELGSRVQKLEGDIAGLWTALREDRRVPARFDGRIEDLERVFEAQWGVLRRMELEGLRIWREVRNVKRQQ